MGTNHKIRGAKERRRPKKSAGDRRRREKTQKKRLVALGMSEKAVSKMDGKSLRTMLRRPACIKAGA